MRIHRVILVTMLLMSVSGASASAASGFEKEYYEAVKLYNHGDFETSIELFEDIAAKPVVNGDLYYNIGNAYFKKGDIGRSILWYERALKLIPGDPDLQFNHHYVSGFVTDKNESVTNPIKNVLLFWKSGLSLRLSVYFSLTMTVLFCILNVLRNLKSHVWLKYVERIVLFISLIFTASTFYDYYSLYYVKEAIVLSETVPVRSGLGDDTTLLFSLHAGTRIRVEDELRGYAKIRFAEDKIGWLDKKCIGMINVY